MSVGPRVVVIGGGVIGAATTYWLARRGRRVTLLERGRLSGGASGECGGFLFLQSKAPGPLLELARESLELYRRELPEAIRRACRFRPSGGLVVATEPTTEALLERRAAALEAAGIPLQRWRGSDLPSWLSTRVRLATHCPLEATVMPAAVAPTLAAAAAEAGADIREYTPARALEQRGGRVRAVRTDSERLEADWVVLAAGAWTPPSSSACWAPRPSPGAPRLSPAGGNCCSPLRGRPSPRSPCWTGVIWL